MGSDLSTVPEASSFVGDDDPSLVMPPTPSASIGNMQVSMISSKSDSSETFDKFNRARDDTFESSSSVDRLLSRALKRARELNESLHDLTFADPPQKSARVDGKTATASSAISPFAASELLDLHPSSEEGESADASTPLSSNSRGVGSKRGQVRGPQSHHRPVRQLPIKITINKRALESQPGPSSQTVPNLKIEVPDVKTEEVLEASVNSIVETIVLSGEPLTDQTIDEIISNEIFSANEINYITNNGTDDLREALSRKFGIDADDKD